MSSHSSLYGPEPLTEVVLTWYCGTPTAPGPINVQFYGFRGHKVTPNEIFQMLEIVYQGLRRDVDAQAATSNGQPAMPENVTVTIPVGAKEVV